MDRQLERHGLPRLSESRAGVTYFAYGSNMAMHQMQERCRSAMAIGRAVLPGHELCFPRRSARWGGGSAGVRAKAGGAVWGALYVLSSDDLRRLDGHEGVHADPTRHVLQTLAVRWNEVHIDAAIYLAIPESREYPPPREYVKTMVRGARQHRLPRAYVDTIYSCAARAQRWHLPRNIVGPRLRGCD